MSTFTDTENHIQLIGIDHILAQLKLILLDVSADLSDNENLKRRQLMSVLRIKPCTGHLLVSLLPTTVSLISGLSQAF
jgi:hypothetical protein